MLGRNYCLPQFLHFSPFQLSCWDALARDFSFLTAWFRLYWKLIMAGKAFRPMMNQFSSVQSLSHVRLFATPWTTSDQASLYITNSRSLLKLMSIELVMPSNRLILCRPLLLPPSIFPSKRVFSNESVLYIRMPKYWSFSFNISPSSEYSGLISFGMDWLDLLAVHESGPDTNRRLWT